MIAARIETAVKRAGLAVRQKALPEQASVARSFGSDRLRRSRLYLPGTEPKYFINAALHGPTLSFSISKIRFTPRRKMLPASWCATLLRAVDFGSCERMVRINQLPLGLETSQKSFPSRPT